MPMQSTNPATGELLGVYEYWDAAMLDAVLTASAQARFAWAKIPLETRCGLFRRLAEVLRAEKQKFAHLVTSEMGKLYRESEGEIDKCIAACDYYAKAAPSFLQPELIATDAKRSYVAFQPLGTVLAVMPWNFPVWQVFRFAIPALLAGNTALLKHASNVPLCALQIEAIFREAGFPQNVFRTLLISSDQVAGVIADSRVHALTLTGSEAAGRKVAAAAGKALKPSVLELGGSDPFIVCPDADQEEAVRVAVMSRYLNCGQSCIAAKRFILVGAAADWFVPKFILAVRALRPGDPFKDSSTLAPMARIDLRDELHSQVKESLKLGAVALSGCEVVPGKGAFYQASILDQVRPGMPAYDEELFGPVAVIQRVADTQAAVALANNCRFGLGASVWTADPALGEVMALRLECGVVFVNGIVKSDPRLPFGGIKASGYGRELSYYGLREFVNIKTVWIK